MRRCFEGWDERVGELVMAAEEETVMRRRIWTFDPDLKWETDLTGTVIGGSILRPRSIAAA